MSKSLQTVASLADRPAVGLARGQVGTVVESLDDKTALVESSGDDGRAYAMVPCPRDEFLVLSYEQRVAEWTLSRATYRLPCSNFTSPAADTC